MDLLLRQGLSDAGSSVAASGLSKGLKKLTPTKMRKKLSNMTSFSSDDKKSLLKPHSEEWFIEQLKKIKLKKGDFEAIMFAREGITMMPHKKQHLINWDIEILENLSFPIRGIKPNPLPKLRKEFKEGKKERKRFKLENQQLTKEIEKTRQIKRRIKNKDMIMKKKMKKQSEKEFRKETKQIWKDYYTGKLGNRTQKTKNQLKKTIHPVFGTIIS